MIRGGTWNESKHARDKSGRFAPKGGGGPRTPDPHASVVHKNGSVEVHLTGGKYPRYEVWDRSTNTLLGEVRATRQWRKDLEQARGIATHAHPSGRKSPDLKLAYQDVTVNLLPGAAEVARNLFGRDLENHEFAALVGALPGSRTNVYAAGRDITFQTTGPGGSYMNQRRIRKRNGDLIMDNEVFEVVTDHRGQGIGTRVFARQVDTARALGIKEITTLAEGNIATSRSNGYYTWPRLGYNFEPSISEDNLFRTRISDEWGRDMSLHELFDQPGGAEWWKQNGGALDLVFDPAQGSPHSQRLNAYLESRGIDPYG